MAGDRIVIAGTGLAALRSAERLRELGFVGEIVLVGSEATMPYYRPALSKQFLGGQMTERDLKIEQLEDLDLVWRVGTQIQGLNLKERHLLLPGGERLPFDGLVIATGAEARRIDGGQHADPRITPIRTFDDVARLRLHLRNDRLGVAVLGTGVLGCEAASTLVHMGRRVTMIGRDSAVMRNVIGDELAARLTRVHEDNGVTLALRNTVRQWVLNPDSIELVLTDGRRITVGVVVVAAGTVPAVEWLRSSGLPLDDGVVCEPTCHVVGTEDVVAAGDVARWANMRYDDVPRRIEQWMNATEMGRAAAHNLLAGRAQAAPYLPLISFWSEQHGVRLHAAGLPPLGSEVVPLPTPASAPLMSYRRDGRVVGVVGLNCSGEVLRQAELLLRDVPKLRWQRSELAASKEREAV
jgi:NADPH-dependent 2,4-dienoyl-CoA reductase/sulfur reductase-like enzyme